MGNKATIDKYETKATVDEYRTKAIVAPYNTKVTNIQMVLPSDVTLFEWEARLESGYVLDEKVNPITNFASGSNIGPNAIQSDPDKQTLFKTDEINSHPAILFDAVDDFYDHDDTYEKLFKSTKFGFLLVVKVLDGQPASGQVFYGTRNYTTGTNQIEDEISIVLQPDGHIRVDYRANVEAMRYTTDNPVFVDGENPWHTLLFHLDFDNDIVTFRKDTEDLAVSATSNSTFSPITDIDPTQYAEISSPDNPALGALEDSGDYRLFINAKYTAFYKNAVNLADLKVKEDEYFTRYDDTGEQPIQSIVDTAQFYNEIRLEEGYSDEENVEPLTNFADSGKPNGTQGTPAKIPEFVANDLNGHPSILADGVDDFYDMGDTYEDVFRGDFGFVMPVKVLDGRPDSFEMLIGTVSNAGAPDNGFELWNEGGGQGFWRTRYSAGENSHSINSNFQHSSGENPWEMVGVFWDFTNNQVRLRINGSDDKIDSFSGLDPTQYVNSFNPYIFCRNTAGDPRGLIDVRTPSPGVFVQSLSDLQNAETKLNEKYAIY